MTGSALQTRAEPEVRQVALLKAIGLDRAAPEQRELALNIAKRYDLDLLLKHLVLIEGRPYITRDGLLHVAHRSGKLDGIETTEPKIVDGFWRASCSVYRKDMGRPFTYGGRYPTSGGNQKFAPEMAVKVAEVQALRRAFDVSAPTVEERWDIEAPAEETPRQVPLAERVAKRRAELARPAAETAERPHPASAVEASVAPAVQPDSTAVGGAAGETAAAPAALRPCDAEDRMLDTGSCALPVGHGGNVHRNASGTWPTVERAQEPRG